MPAYMPLALAAVTGLVSEATWPTSRSCPSAGTAQPRANAAARNFIARILFILRGSDYSAAGPRRVPTSAKRSDLDGIFSRLSVNKNQHHRRAHHSRSPWDRARRPSPARLSGNARDVAQGRTVARARLHGRLPGPARLRRLLQAERPARSLELLQAR